MVHETVTTAEISSTLAWNKLISGRYRVHGKRIGSGNFGEVRLGLDLKTGAKIAVKIEKTGKRKGKRGEKEDTSLQHEAEILDQLSGIRGFPSKLYYGVCGKAKCLVLSLLGPNLEDLLRHFGGKFTLKTVLMIALQMLDRIERVHRAGLVYRDVKPENFLIGRDADSNVIHLVDFGLAVPYLDPTTGCHLPLRNLKTMVQFFPLKRLTVKRPYRFNGQKLAAKWMVV